MSKLIALVTVAAVVDGVRQEFPPGSELPKLPEHDVQVLKRMKAVEDVTETAAADKAAAKAETRAGADFQNERQAIRQQMPQRNRPRPQPPQSPRSADPYHPTHNPTPQLTGPPCHPKTTPVVSTTSNTH